MRLVIARCSVDYEGRLQAHLPLATRLLMVKADGSVLVHSDGGSYKPLNWMSPPCAMAEVSPEEHEVGDGVSAVWVVQHAKSDDRLRVRLHEVLHDSAHELGVDPGLVKDGVEAHLQKLLAEHIGTARRGLHPGPARVHDRDRPGRHPAAGTPAAPAWPSRSSAAATSTASSS